MHFQFNTKGPQQNGTRFIDDILKETSWENVFVFCWGVFIDVYREISNIRRVKSQNLNDPRLVLELSLLNPLRPGVKSRTKMLRQAMLQLFLSDQRFNGLLRRVLY